MYEWDVYRCVQIEFGRFKKKLERIDLDNKNLVWIDYFFKKGYVLERASRTFIEMCELFEN